MNEGEGWKTAALAYVGRIRGALAGIASSNPFFGGVIRAGGGTKGGRGTGRNAFFGGRGGDAYGDQNAISVGSVPGPLRSSGRRWSGSAMRRPGRGSAEAVRRAGLVVVRFGSRTLKQSLGSPTAQLPSSAVARLKVRTLRGMSGSMSGLPGVTVATHNGVRNNGPKKR
ncbi:MAG: hypothetical protein EXS64_15290 [Candidatus Latescibacteria bacterium]|nr:hypothetical protein [Candidatus Latescibacterota bacterium]